MMKVELYRKSGKKLYRKGREEIPIKGRQIVNRIGHTTETRDSLRHLILENRSHRPEYIPRPAMPDELFQPRPSAPPDRARCRPSLPVPGRLRTAALPARRFAGLSAQPAEGKRLR